jgi:hypothetical protein
MSKSKNKLNFEEGESIEQKFAENSNSFEILEDIK